MANKAKHVVCCVALIVAPSIAASILALFY
jgi:hypothetical protein